MLLDKSWCICSCEVCLRCIVFSCLTRPSAAGTSESDPHCASAGGTIVGLMLHEISALTIVNPFFYVAEKPSLPIRLSIWAKKCFIVCRVFHFCPSHLCTVNWYQTDYTNPPLAGMIRQARNLHECNVVHCEHFRNHNQNRAALCAAQPASHCRHKIGVSLFSLSLTPLNYIILLIFF